MILKFQQSSANFLTISRVDDDLVMLLTDLANPKRNNVPWDLYPLVFKPVYVEDCAALRAQLEKSQQASERFRKKMQKLAAENDGKQLIINLQTSEIETLRGRIEHLENSSDADEVGAMLIDVRHHVTALRRVTAKLNKTGMKLCFVPRNV